MMATTVNDDGMKASLAVSAVLHTLFFLFLYFGLPILMPPLPEHHDVIPFEIVTVADITNTRIKQEEPKPEPKPEPPPPKAESKPEPAPQALPQPKPPEPEALAPLPKPAVKPKPPEPVKPKTDDFARLLKNLESHKTTETPKTESKAETKTPSQAQATSQAPALSDRLTVTQEDALRRQVEQCWNMPVGARDAQSLVVQLVVDVNPDRTVQHAEVVDKSRIANDPFYRAAAEAAVRAMYDPRCTPLEVPSDKYETWKRIYLTFDPRDM